PAVHCSVMRTKSTVSGLLMRWPPYRCSVVPHPASNSTRLVVGDENVICCVRDGGPISPWPSASGEVVGLGNPFCGPAPVHVRQMACSSQKMPNLARCAAWNVSRRLAFSHVRSWMAWFFRSGAYVQALGLPALRFWYM